MELSDILCVIVNHNNNENALNLKSLFSHELETIIIDSGSNTTHIDFYICLDNVYYTGLFNEAYNQLKIRNKRKLFFICSDVKVISDNIIDCIKTIPEDCYYYSPSVEGRCKDFAKNKGTNSLRSVNFIEGFIFLIDKEILDIFMPIDWNLNRYGYFIDILCSYYTLIKNKKILIDDRCIVYHPESIGYDELGALTQMYNHLNHYIKNIDSNISFFFSYFSEKISDSDFYKMLNAINELSITVLITTIGKDTLSDMLDSLKTQLNFNDNLYILVDGEQYHEESKKIIESKLESFRCNVEVIYETENHGYWGHGIRNKYQKNLNGDYILHGDDDDVYLPHSISMIKNIIKYNHKPNTTYMFKFYHNYNQGESYWKTPEIKLANVGTPCGIIPNIPSKMGEWGYRYGGDFDFYNSCDFNFMFVDKFIYTVKPKINGQPN